MRRRPSATRRTIVAKSQDSFFNRISLLGAFALHDLPDLASDTLEQRQEDMIPLTDLAAEELRHSEQFVTEEDRECEACVESYLTGKSCARKIVVIVNIGNPGGL